APVLAAPEVVVLLAPRVAGEARLRSLLGAVALERVNLQFFGRHLVGGFAGVNGGLHGLDVRLARPVARLTPDDLSLPTLVVLELGVRRVREALSLILVARRAGVRANVVRRIITLRDGRRRLLRRALIGRGCRENSQPSGCNVRSARKNGAARRRAATRGRPPSS